MEKQAVIKFSYPAWQVVEVNSRHSDKNSRGTCTIVCHSQNWVAQFQRGNFPTCEAPRPGRHKTVNTPKFIDQIHEIILEERRISAKSIAEQLGISCERVGSTTHEDLDMRKLSAKWVPKCLKADQKPQRCHSSEQIWNFFRSDPNDFLSRLVTMDETWLYHYDPDTQQQSMEWRHSDSLRPQKKSECKNPLEEFSPPFFGDNQDSILPIDYLPKGQTINAEYYSFLLVQLTDILKEKRRGKFTKGVLFLHDNAPAHRALATKKKLAYLCFQCLDHPPYSPDLAPSDYHLFPGLKNQSKGRHFSSDAEVIPAAETWLDGQTSEYF